MKKLYTLLIVVVLLAIFATGCFPAADGAPRNAEIIDVVASTNLQGWLDEAAKEFNGQREKSPQGKTYFVQVTYMDAGRAVSSMGEDNGSSPGLWIPDNATWSELLAGLGNSAYEADCVSTAQSPLVIAMWRPLAEALGWPGRDLGWLDIGSLAADPSAWEYYSGGQYGPTLRLGHAHPGLSAAGTNTLLAVVQAAEGQQAAVGVDDIQESIVQASVTAFESSVATFGSSTLELGQLMESRGESYLNAAILYENTVAEYAQQGLDIIPIYPFEGTYMADFPACISTAGDEEEAAGSQMFRNYLLSPDGQQLAVEHGLRALDGATVDASAVEEFIDLAAPEIVFENPPVETIFAAQELWQSSRKAVNMVLVIDTSGSMRGQKIESVKRAASDFVEAMGSTDYLTILYYDADDEVVPLVYHEQIESNRDRILADIGSLEDYSGTPLYDSIGAGAEVIADTNSSQRTNAMVVLTDGLDTASETYRFDERLIASATSNNTAIYSIAFGNDANEKMLEDLALQANGNFYLGNEANITEIYQEMSVLFGGSAGIGR